MALASLDSDSRGYSIGVSKGPHRRYALQQITLMWPPYKLVYVAPFKKLQYTPELCHCAHDSEGCSKIVQIAFIGTGAIVE